MAIFLQLSLILALWLTAITEGTTVDNLVLSVRMGRHHLLPTTNNRTTTKNPQLPWGKGIRFKPDTTEECQPFWKASNWGSLLLQEVARTVGPVYCVHVNAITEGRSKAFKKGLMDVIAAPFVVRASPESALYPLIQDDACIIGKRMEPRRQNIAQAFSPSTWAATGVGLFLFGAAQRLASRRFIPLEALRTFLTGIFLKSRRPVENFLSLALSTYGLIMVNAFSGKMMSFLAVNKEPIQPQTLAEVDARINILIDGLALASWMHKFDNQDIFVKLLAKKPPDNVNIWKALATSLQHALLIPQSVYEKIDRNPRWVDKTTTRSLTHLVPQCVLAPSFPIFHVNPDWPHRERFNALLQRAVESGIPKKVFSIIYNTQRQNGLLVRESPPSQHPEPLTMAAMLDPLVLLGVGVALAVVAFVGELAVCRWRRLRQWQQWRSERLRQRRR